MHLALTLIAGAGKRLVPPCATIAEVLQIEAEPIWLAPGEACDFMLEAIDAAAIETVARAAFGAAAVDVVVQPAGERRKRLLVADMESTIIENEMLDELAQPLGLQPQIAEITRRAMNGEIDFLNALQQRVALLAGIEESALDQAAERIRLTPGARTLVATMRRAGAVTALVSGGFSFFAERVAAELGFDRVVANKLDLRRGRISGTVQPPIVGGEAKRRALISLAAESGVPLGQTIAVGDGANDLSMLEAAGVGIAFRAKPLVAAAARWRLDYADLTGLLYAQGYRKDEFVG
jgi:phosphoserine phosphatase